MKRAIGITLIISVFIGLFIITALSYGFIDALIAWLIAFGITAVICLGAYLIDTSEG